MTNLSSNQVQLAETRKLVDLLTQKKLAFELVDGSAVESRDRRNEMWEKSGKRSYPQVFLNGEVFGDLDTIQVRAPTSHRSRCAASPPRARLSPERPPPSSSRAPACSTAAQSLLDCDEFDAAFKDHFIQEE